MLRRNTNDEKSTTTFTCRHSTANDRHNRNWATANVGRYSAITTTSVFYHVIELRRASVSGVYFSETCGANARVHNLYCILHMPPSISSEVGDKRITDVFPSSRLSVRPVNGSNYTHILNALGVCVCVCVSVCRAIPISGGHYY